MRVVRGFAILLAMPVVQIANLIAYARLQDGLAARVSTFVVLMPTLIWGTAIATVVWLVVLKVLRAIGGFMPAPL
jgi:hypothetical protein